MDVFESSWLKNLDTDVLLAINGLSSPVADTIMWWVSDKWVWLPFYLLLTVMIVRRTGFARGLAAIIAVAVLIVAVDQTCALLIRPALMRREYWKVSPWIGVAGYAVAAGTGFFRMYNNRHWLTDVIAGAGIGILSAQAAYWLYPVVTKAFFRKRYKKNIFLSPYASRREGGFVCQITF